MKKIITTIFVLSCMFINAQDMNYHVESHLFKVNLLLTPGIEYEVGLTKNTTADFRIGTGLRYVRTTRDRDYGIFLTFEGAYRYYYNFEKRLRKGKNTTRNSANYLAMTTYFAHTEPIIGNLDTNIDFVGQVGPVWGFQRTYRYGLNLGLELGLGYDFSDTDKSIVPIFNFRLGWAFGK
ncbi:hypothetical protein [Aquimarina aquimarini]|uniref:hypothetical protein n=1 Tax=Aquimarina aquimarini TaxID=1191734 RepID=UPI00131EE9EC|nr:hypothetical protein [Aquimarina aquimarini]